MLHRLKTILLAIVSFVIVVFGLLWMVMFLPMFAQVRSDAVEHILSEAIGQQVVIETDVRADLGPTTYIRARNVVVPSYEVANLNLAELDLLELNIDVLDLIAGDLDLNDLVINGLRVNLRKLEDDTTSWSAPLAFNGKNATTGDSFVTHSNGIVAFLSDRNTSISEVFVNYEDESSGFEFLFDLQEFQIEQMEAANAVSLKSIGKINDQAFQIAGYYPRGQPKLTEISISELSAEFAAQVIPDEQGGGFEGDLQMKVGEFGEIFDVLKLERIVEGTGEFNAHIKRQGVKLSIADISTTMNFENGAKVSVTGNADDVLSSLDFDVTVNGQMFPEGNLPQKARDISELELTQFDANLVSISGEVEFKEVNVGTNYAEREFRQFGPISVGKIKRTPTGSMLLEDVEAQVGPRDSPYIFATGQVADLFQLKQLDLTGEIRMPSNLAFPRMQDDKILAFGRVAGDFQVSDKTGQLALDVFDLRSEDTDLWSLKASAKSARLNIVDGVDFSLDLEIPDSDAFLAGLELDAVGLGPATLSIKSNGVDQGVTTSTSVRAGGSDVRSDLSVVLDDQRRATVRGAVSSKLLALSDLEKAIQIGLRIASLDADLARSQRDQTDTRNVQPLILASDVSVRTPSNETRPDGRKVQPLVLTTDKENANEGDFFRVEEIGRGLDMEIDINLEKITGQAGVSRISSKILAKDGKAELLPIEFSLGEGHFTVGAGISFIEAPDKVHFFGSAGGWDLGNLLKQAGADIDAKGIIKLQFDLIGNNGSAQSFIDTAMGSATLSMVNGAIETSLLELAGLGVFQWLVSQQLQQGYTDIVCAVVPLRLVSGTASSNAIVVETTRVQVVAQGYADWGNDRIAFRAEPRPVGQPLARSPWPFEVTGKLTNPDFDIGRQNRSLIGANGPKVIRTEDRTPCRPDAQQGG